MKKLNVLLLGLILSMVSCTGTGLAPEVESAIIGSLMSGKKSGRISMKDIKIKDQLGSLIDLDVEKVEKKEGGLTEITGVAEVEDLGRLQVAAMMLMMGKDVDMSLVDAELAKKKDRKLRTLKESFKYHLIEKDGKRRIKLIEKKKL